MGFLYLVPHWFFGFDIFLEFIFALVTLGVALYSLRIYSLSGQNECRVFGAGFIFISLAHFLWAGVNLFIASRVSEGRLVLSLDQLSVLGALGVYSYVLLSTVGFATLAYMTLGSRKQRTYVLICTLSLLAIVFSQYKALAFYFVSSFLLLFVVAYYIDVYRSTHKTSNFLVLFATIFIFLGTVDFIFATLQEVHYVIGHILYLFGYALILISFISTLRS